MISYGVWWTLGDLRVVQEPWVSQWPQPLEQVAVARVFFTKTNNTHCFCWFCWFGQCGKPNKALLFVCFCFFGFFQTMAGFFQTMVIMCFVVFRIGQTTNIKQTCCFCFCVQIEGCLYSKSESLP